MPHNPWGSSARRPCARWHPPAIRGPVPFLPSTNHVHASTGSARTERRPLHHTKVRIQPRNAPHSTVRPEQHKKPSSPFAWKLTKPHTYRSLGPHKTPTTPFALSLSKGQRELRNSYPFPRTSTGSARTEPRPRHHTKVCIQPRNAPTQPFAWSITKSHPHRSPGASRYTNLTVRWGLTKRQPHRSP